jgi:hypothetical protein
VILGVVRARSVEATVNLEDGTAARLALEKLVDDAGLYNIIIALFRNADDRAEALRQQDSEAAERWGRRAYHLAVCAYAIQRNAPRSLVDRALRFWPL